MGTAERQRDDARPADVTRLLRDAAAGDRDAARDLLPLVYDQLRALARQRMRGERSDQTLQATALVHEAYIRLVGENGDAADPRWDGRRHFFAAAAEAMRRILVDRARRRQRHRHGGGLQRVELDLAAPATTDAPPERLIELDHALRALAADNPDRARLVELRFFAGLTIKEAADALHISTATAERQWTYARAWLYRRMAGNR